MSMPVLCLDTAMKSFDVVAETRRRWTAEERRQIVAESETGSVSAVARRHGVAVSLVFRWRRQAGLPGKRASVKVREEGSVSWARLEDAGEVCGYGGGKRGKGDPPKAQIQNEKMPTGLAFASTDTFISPTYTSFPLPPLTKQTNIGVRPGGDARARQGFAHKCSKC